MAAGTVSAFCRLLLAVVTSIFKRSSSDTPVRSGGRLACAWTSRDDSPTSSVATSSRASVLMMASLRGHHFEPPEHGVDARKQDVLVKGFEDVIVSAELEHALL